MFSLSWWLPPFELKVQNVYCKFKEALCVCLHLSLLMFDWYYSKTLCDIRFSKALYTYIHLLMSNLCLSGIHVMPVHKPVCHSCGATALGDFFSQEHCSDHLWSQLDSWDIRPVQTKTCNPTMMILISPETWQKHSNKKINSVGCAYGSSIRDAISSGGPERGGGAVSGSISVL